MVREVTVYHYWWNTWWFYRPGGPESVDSDSPMLSDRMENWFDVSAEVLACDKCCCSVLFLLWRFGCWKSRGRVSHHVYVVVILCMQRSGRRLHYPYPQLSTALHYTTLSFLLVAITRSAKHTIQPVRVTARSNWHSGTSTLKTTLTMLLASTTTLFQLHTRITYIKFSQLILWHILDLSRNIWCLNFKNEVHNNNTNNNIAYLFYKINTRYTLKINVCTVSFLRILEDTEANTESSLWVHLMCW